MRLDLNDKSILVIVAGPSASGKSTFIDQIIHRKKSSLVARTFESLGVSPEFRFCLLKANQARRSIKKGEDSTMSCQHRLMHLDWTSKHRGKNLRFCPIIFSRFQAVYSIQIYLPYEYWLKRIRSRADSGEGISDRAQTLIDHAETDYRLGERMYRQLYARWENYLDLRRVRPRITIDTVSKIVFEKPPADIRRNLFSRAVYSVICRRPLLTD